MTEALDSLTSRLLRQVDIAWLAGFRVLFGLMMVVSMLRYVAFDWIDPFFVTPSFHFKYWGFGWVEPLPGPLMHGLVYALAALAACVTLGLYFRVTSWLFAFGFAYLQLIDVATYLNHYYLAGLLAFLLPLTPAGRAWSLDVWRRPELRRDSVAVGAHYLLRFQVGIVYVCAGLAKGTSDWLVHAMPLRIWLGSKTDMPGLGLFFQQAWAAPAMSWAGFLFDTTIVLWLLWPRTRALAIAAVIFFHSVTSALFPIGMFPVIMASSALVMFSASWPRVAIGAVARALEALGRAARPLASAVRRAAAPGAFVESATQPAAWHRFALVAAMLFVGAQVVMPMRYLAYGDSVLWHEQGMRFSWRVMVREKNGSVQFVARDLQSGRTSVIAPRQYLSRWQEQEMWSQPDLILQLGQHIHRTLEHDTGRPHQLFVDARVSLNGRRSRPLIDPGVDLASVHDGLGKAWWITPAPQEPPPHLQPVAQRETSGAEVLLACHARPRAAEVWR
jgi:vitamin K-dependent gamma-carboxylase